MIVVDTNVWSESMRQAPDDSVMSWLRESHRELYLASVTVMELQYDVLKLPAGSRREQLEAVVAVTLARLKRRVLSYDADSAYAHAELRLQAKRAGRALSAEDGQILAIASARGAVVATRNVGDFANYGIPVINPWLPAGG